MPTNDATLPEDEPGSTGRTHPLTKVIVLATVVGVPLLAGVLILAMVAAGVVVIALNAQQASLGCTRAEDSDGSVPLPADAAAAPLTVNVGTWNTDTTNTRSSVTKGIQALDAAGADVIGLQEVSPTKRRNAIEKTLEPVWAFSAGASSTPIAWQRAHYDLLTQGDAAEAGAARTASDSGASIGGRVLPWVQLRDRKTKATFFVVNQHLVSGIDHAGRPDGDEDRFKLYQLQMRVMLAKVDELAKSGPVFVTGDFGIAAKTDAQVRSAAFPYTQADEHGLHSNWRALGYPVPGTRRGGHVDYVWATTAQAAPTRQQILDRYRSDHHAVLVALSNARAVAEQQDQQANLTLTERTRETDAATAGSYHDIRQRQVANARLLAEGVRRAGGTGQAVYLTLLAAVGESDLINVTHGDRAGPDSLGLLQQRQSWGSVKQRLDPVWAGAAFMLGPQHRGHGGLLDLPGWQQLPPTVAIHRVQINADPNHYTRFDSRAREIGQQAGVDFDAPAGRVTVTNGADATSCSGSTTTTKGASPTGVGTGPCPLDRLHAPGKRNPRDCNAALAYMTEQMSNGSRAWRRQCLALVAVAYGWQVSNACQGGSCTAFIGAQQVMAAGKMSTDRTNIPKGAVMWWDGRATGNPAGHVAIYDGNGHILSNDVPVTDGRVGRVPWTYPETNWHQRWLGWSPPYFPNAS